MPGYRVRLSLLIQRALGLVMFPVLGPLIVMMIRLRGLRVENLGAVRQKFKALVAANPGPLLVCANHITRVDTVLIDWALASNWTWFWRFNLLPWNLPERRNYAHNPVLRLVCYLCKCVPIVRDGTTAEKKETMARLTWLLARGHSVGIFPEGTRTHTGQLDMDNFGYGIGQLATGVKDPVILCVYLRGYRQKSRTSVPLANDCLHVDLDILKPVTPHRGRRAARDISIQTMERLQAMEAIYFEQHPDMRPTSDVPQEHRGAA